MQRKGMRLILRMLVQKKDERNGDVSFVNHAAASACATINRSSFGRKMSSVIIGQTEFRSVMREHREEHKLVWRKSPLSSRKHLKITRDLSICYQLV